MDEDSATLCSSLLNESNDFIQVGIFRIKQVLRLVLSPRECEIIDALLLIKIWHVSATAINDVSDLVHHDPLLVLRSNGRNTCAAIWSPIKSPSLILVGPKTLKIVLVVSILKI